MRMVKKACHETASGGSRGGVRGTRPLPPYFYSKLRPKGHKTFCLEPTPPPPPYLRVWMTPPPYLKVWIRHYEKSFTFTFTTLCVHHAFLVHFFAVTALLITTWKCLFTFRRGRERRTTTFSFFSWTLIQSFRIEPQKKLPTFDELKEMG